MIVPVRLAVRRLQLELLICLTASLLLAAGTLFLANAAAYTSDVEPVPSWIGLVLYIRGALLCLPVLAGVVFGASLIAAELDQGTSVFAWSVALDRRRWLADTAVAGVLMVLAVSVPIAGVTWVLGSSMGAQLDATSSPWGVDPSALLLIARPIAAFSIAALVGAILGRSLPTLIVAILVSCLVLGALEIGFSTWRQAEAAPIDLSTPSVLYVGDRLAAMDGRLLSDQEASAAAENGAGYLALYQHVPVGLTPQARASMLACQVGLTLVAGAAALLIAGVLIERRRPA